MQQKMASPTAPAAQKVDRLAHVTNGMLVYDSFGKKVGHVDGMYGGTLGETPASSVQTVPAPAAVSGGQPVPVVAEVAAPAKVPVFDDIFDGDDGFPRELRERMEHDGFIRIDAGFLKHHRFALRDQIEHVVGEEVTLNVTASELIKH